MFIFFVGLLTSCQTLEHNSVIHYEVVHPTPNRIMQSYFFDGDADGYGNPAITVQGLRAPLGFVDNAQDCNDSNALSYPGAPERCDQDDNNCDGFTDEDNAIDTLLWYADSDGDGYGDKGVPFSACFAPVDYVGDATDCDDQNEDVYPGSMEQQNQLDDDCDGVVDELD